MMGFLNIHFLVLGQITGKYIFQVLHYRTYIL
jgi:hypothetical protein